MTEYGIMITIGILLLLSHFCHSSTSGSSGSSSTETGMWSKSTSGMFSYQVTSGSDTYYVSGCVDTSGGFYGSGSASKSSSGGSMSQESICISGYSYSGSWYGYGQMGFNSLTASGKAPSQSYSENMYGTSGSGTITLDPNTLSIVSGGATTLAFCGSYSSSSGSGSGMNMFMAMGSAAGYDKAKQVQTNYNLNINSYDSGMSGMVSYNTMSTASGSGATASSDYGSGCFTSLTTDTTGMFSASGYLGQSTFSATGTMKNGFWMTNTVTATSGMGLVGGSYQPMCSSSGSSSGSSGSLTPGISGYAQCSGTFYTQTSPSTGTSISGQMSENGTWTAGLMLPTPFPQTTTFSGTYSGGYFMGYGTTNGLTYSATGVYGNNCFYTQSQSLTCPGKISGLQSGYYGGCGSVTGNTFYASGDDNGSYWSLTGTVSGDKASGTVTTPSGSESFSTSYSPTTGTQYTVNVGSAQHSVTVFRLGNSLLIAGQSTSSSGGSSGSSSGGSSGSGNGSGSGAP